MIAAAGKVIAVGSGQAGQLGRAATTFTDSSVMAFAPLNASIRVSQLAVAAVDNEAYVLALCYDSLSHKRVVFGWGANQASSLAGFSGVPSSVPRELIYLTADMKNRVPIAISAASFHSSVQLDTNYIVWSSSAASPAATQFGWRFSEVAVDIRDRIPGNDDFVILATAPVENTCTYGILRGNGRVIMRWGRGYPDPVQLTYPSQLRITAVSVGEAFGLFLNTGGEVWAHGTNVYGELGNTTFPRSSDERIVRVNNLQGNVVSMAAVRRAGLAVKSDGSLWMWGTMPEGDWASFTAGSLVYPPAAVDLSATFPFAVPSFSQVFTAPGLDATYIITLNSTIFLLDTTGRLFSFGANNYGQLCRGISPSAANFSATADVVNLPAWATVKTVTVGPGYSVIQTANNSIFGCGYNGRSQLAPLPSASVCLYPYCINSSAVSVPTPSLIPRVSPFPQASKEILAVATSMLGLYAITGDNSITSSYGGQFNFDVTTGAMAARNVSVIAALGIDDFLVAGPLEPAPLSTVVPQTATAIRIGGKGFPYLANVQPSDELTVKLSEGSCTVTSTYLDASVFPAVRYLTCTTAPGTNFTLGSTLSATLTVKGETSANITLGRIVLPPTVVADSSSNVISWGGQRRLLINGYNFGNIKEDIDVTVVLGYSASDPKFPCNVISVVDTMISCDVQVPARSMGSIYVQVFRLSSPSSAAPQPFAQLFSEWSLSAMNQIVPANAKAVFCPGSSLIYPNTSTTVEYQFLNVSTGVPLTAGLNPCVRSFAANHAGNDLEICELPAGSLSPYEPGAVNIKLFVTRAGYTISASAGNLGPSLSLQGRPAAAKVARSASFFLFPSPFSESQFSNFFGSGLLSDVIYANVSVVSSKRDVASVNGSTDYNAMCTVSRFYGGNFACEYDGTDTLQLASGSVWADVVVRGYGMTFRNFIGDVVDGPTLTTTSRKVAMVSGVMITITGSNFADGAFTGSDNLIRIASQSNYLGQASSGPGLGSWAAQCYPVGGTSSIIMCNTTSYIYAPANEPLLAEVFSWGASSGVSIVGTLVDQAKINIFRERFNVSDTTIRINGTGFYDDHSETKVRLARQQGNGRAYTDCAVVVEQSDKNTVTCKLASTDIVSNQGERLYVSVYANGAWSQDAAGVVGSGDSNNSSDNLGSTIGAGVGIAVAIVVIIVVVVLVVVLIRRKKSLKDIKGQLTQVPEAFASMFNIKTTDLEIKKKLGEGSFGAVFLADYKSPKGVRQVAVKKLTSSMLAASVDGFFREAVRFLCLLDPRNSFLLIFLCPDPHDEYSPFKERCENLWPLPRIEYAAFSIARAAGL